MNKKYTKEAASLFARRYRQTRQENPNLPSLFADATVIVERLEKLLLNCPGVVAIRNGRLVGFLAAYLLHDFRGQRAVYSPEWANSAEDEGTGRTYQEMYTSLAARWVANGYLTHIITTLAEETVVHQTLHWLGFGMIAADALRDLSTVKQNVQIASEIRLADAEHVDDVAALSEALQRYLASAPTFLPFVEKHDRAYHKHWLADPANRLWLAYIQSEPVAFIALQPPNPDACDIIQDRGTVSITGAFTVERRRGNGLGSALLHHAIDWARSSGFQRCAVDFEPQNPLAASFWLKHFKPICYSFVRQVDMRILWANCNRQCLIR